MRKLYMLIPALLLSVLSIAQHSRHSGAAYPFVQKAPSEIQYPGKTIQNKRSIAVWSEDFANGFNSTNGTWAAGGIDGAIWKHDYYGSKGCFSSNASVPNFTSSNNGFMLFDVDSVNCIDSTANPPTYNQTPRSGHLISPSIDLSSETTCIVSLEHYYLLCCTGFELHLGISTDSLNWTEFDITDPSGSPSGPSSNPFVSEVNISSIAAGQSNVYLRFRWENLPFYFWVIDDINICPAPDHEIGVLRACWESTRDEIPYTMVPVTQAQDFKSYVTIENGGSNPQNVTFKKEITGVVSLNANGINSPQAIQVNDLVADSSVNWNSGSVTGNSTQTFSIDYPNIALDNYIVNNEVSYPFWVTHDTYARDFDEYTTQGLWNGDDGQGNTNSYTVALEYGIKNNATVYGLEFAVTPDTDPGVLVYPEIYEIDTVSGSFNLIYTGIGTSDEIAIVGNQISTGPSLATITIPVNGGGQTGGVALTGGKSYLFALGHYGGPKALVMMNGGAKGEVGCKSITGQGIPGNNEVTRQTAFVYDPGPVGGPWFYIEDIPLIRGKLDVVDNVFEYENGISLTQNQPNPFNEASVINFSLKHSANITFEVTDVTGKVVKSISKGNLLAGKHTIDLNGSEFAPGIYHYTVRAGEFSTTKKMVVTD